MSIEVHTDGGIATIAFARPDKKNAITAAMYAAMADGLAAAAADPAVRAVLITGTAECFTAGNDLQDFLANPPSGGESPVWRFLHGLAGFAKPVVAAPCGPAVGVGTTLLPELAVHEPVPHYDGVRLLRFSAPAPSRHIAMYWRTTSAYGEFLPQVADVIRAAVRGLPVRTN